MEREMDELDYVMQDIQARSDARLAFFTKWSVPVLTALGVISAVLKSF